MLRTLLAAIILSSVSVPALAWNDRGHMTVAAVAWANLTPRAKAEATRLLKLNPDYDYWTRDVATDRRDEVAFVKAATWADSIRGRYTDDGFDPVEPTGSLHIGYADRYVHRYWHYKNLPFSPDGTALEPSSDVNAAERIRLFSSALAEPGTSDDIKSFDLSWLLHLVGDIHQPLHASARYTSSFRHGDNGGNSVKVCHHEAAQCGLDDSLHGFWDGAIGNSKDPASAIRKAASLPKPGTRELEEQDPEAWARESFALAETYAYASPIGLKKGPYRLTPSYHRDAGSTSEQRVALAGARLAVMLNRAFR